MFFISVTSGMKGVPPFGLIKLVGGLAFSLGLVLVIIAGAESTAAFVIDQYHLKG